MSEREDLIRGLREFADWLEHTPAAPTPVLPARFDVFLWEDKRSLRETAKVIGGKLTKGAVGDYFFLRRTFGPLNYEVNVDRDVVCERVVIGTRTIPAEPERIIPATEERVEEITEWRCGEVLK